MSFDNSRSSLARVVALALIAVFLFGGGLGCSKGCSGEGESRVVVKKVEKRKVDMGYFDLQALMSILYNPFNDVDDAEDLDEHMNGVYNPENVGVPNPHNLDLNQDGFRDPIYVEELPWGKLNKRTVSVFLYHPKNKRLGVCEIIVTDKGVGVGYLVEIIGNPWFFGSENYISSNWDVPAEFADELFGRDDDRSKSRYKARVMGVWFVGKERAPKKIVNRGQFSRSYSSFRGQCLVKDPKFKPTGKPISGKGKSKGFFEKSPAKSFSKLKEKKKPITPVKAKAVKSEKTGGKAEVKKAATPAAGKKKVDLRKKGATAKSKAGGKKGGASVKIKKKPEKKKKPAVKVEKKRKKESRGTLSRPTRSRSRRK